MTSFNSRLTGKFGYRWDDGAIDEGELTYAKQVVPVDADLQSEAVWHIENRVLASGTQDLWDLGNLNRQVLGDTHTTAFFRIKGILIVNLTDDGTIIVGNAPFDAWWEPFGAVNQTVEAPPDSPVMLVNRKDGWPVQGTPDSSSSSGGGADAQRILGIAAVDGDVTYSIVIIGTLSVPSDSSSSSSSSG